MAKFKGSYILLALFVVLIAMEASVVFGQAKGNGNANGNGNTGSGNGNVNGNGNTGSGNGNANGNGNTGSGNGNANGNGNTGSGNGNANGNGNTGSVNGSGNGNGNTGSGNGNGNTGSGNGNGNGNGNTGSGNGNGNGNGNTGSGNGNGNGNGNTGSGNGNGNGNGNNADVTNYQVLPPLTTGQERCMCKAQGACFYKTLVCPPECPQRKPKQNKKHKGCFVNCGSKCEVTCKFRRANCNGYGSLCYDPRFVGGDGVMFYFHGTKGGNFAIVSDDNLQINAHFIGTRPLGRTRDFTWVQALSIMFDNHNLVIAAKRVSKWDDKVDALIVRWDGESVSIPTDGEAEWRTNGDEERQVIVERTDDTNSVRVTVAELLEMDIKIRPIGDEENKVHKYQIPADDTFAHLETQFRFSNLSDLVEGVLGKTYRPGYVSPVKVGVPMPMMGGEDKYRTPSLSSPLCKVCRFQTSQSAGFENTSGGVASY